MSQKSWSYAILFLRYGTCNSWDMQLLVFILGYFLPLYPHSPSPPHPPIHPPNSPKNQNFEKMKKYLETSSFYKSVPKTMIIHYTVPEILHMWQMLLLFFILACFLPFYSPPNSPKKQFFFKKEKNTWGYHHFTHVHRKWWSDDVWFLRYGAWRTDRWKDRESDGKSDI